MKSIKPIIFLLCLIIFASGRSAYAYIVPAENAKFGKEIVVVHKVRRGDCLLKIAEFWGADLKRILEMNNLDIHDKIYPGQKIKIPTGIFWGKTINYTVQKGDTVLKIARKFGAFPEQIFHDNNLTPRSLIYPGQILKVAKVIVPQKEVIASWYGKDFHGKKAANGKRYDMHKLTAAHRFLPLGMKLKVTYDNKSLVPFLRVRRSIVVEITDRGPWVLWRQLDLSYRAAKRLKGTLIDGIFRVTIETP